MTGWSIECDGLTRRFERLADRVGVLATRLLAEGTPDDLRRRTRPRSLLITVDSSTGAAAAAARGVPGVAAVAINADTNELVVELAEAERRTPDVVAAIVAAGGRITGVTLERPRLEEVYMQLTAEGAEGCA